MGQTLAFDAENRMTAYGSVLTAGYRADGLRAWKQTSAGTTYYLYDGDQPVEELDGSGNKSAVMTFGPNGVLARTTAARTLLYSFDALGQMAQQIDAAGTIVASYLFDAWGARQVNTSDPTAASDPYSGYNTAAGYITDWETGLQLLGHRYFDPATGRFLNRDPIGMWGGVNIYVHCNNSVVGRTDAAGLEDTGQTGGSSGGHGAGVGHSPGSGSPLWGCLPALYDLLAHIGDNTCKPLECALSQMLIGCLAGIAMAALITALAGTGLGVILVCVIGCVANALATALVDAINNSLEKICNPCYDDSRDNCKMAGDAAVACLGGVVAGGIPFLGGSGMEALQEFFESIFGNMLSGFALWGMGFRLSQGCEGK